MTPEDIQNLKDELSQEPEKVKMVIVLRDDVRRCIGDKFDLTIVLGQLHLVQSELIQIAISDQLAAAAAEEPAYMSELFAPAKENVH